LAARFETVAAALDAPPDAAVAADSAISEAVVVAVFAAPVTTRTEVPRVLPTASAARVSASLPGGTA